MNENQNRPSDEAINAWLDRIVLALDLLIITPLLGPGPAHTTTPPRRIQPPRRRTIALWLSRRILRALRSDLNAATRSLV